MVWLRGHIDSLKTPYMPEKQEPTSRITYLGSCWAWGKVPPPRIPRVFLQPSWYLASLWCYLVS